LRKELAQIKQEHTALLKSLELRHPMDAARQGLVAPLTAVRVQEETLKPHQSLVEYVVTEQDVLVFLVNKQACRYFRLPITRTQLVALVEQMHRPFKELQAGRVDLLHMNYDLDLSHRLYGLIFQPIESRLPAGDELIIVPDDVLNYLPFESLVRSTTLGSPEAGLAYAEYKAVDWLVKHFTFSYAISATSLDPRLHQKEPPPRRLLAFGNPAVDVSQHKDIVQAVLRRASEADLELPYLSPLPQAAREAKRVAQLMAGKLITRALTNQLATKREFFQGAPTAGYLHFAVHSLINEDQPHYSALVLAPDQVSDGLLQAFEIYNTPLNSRLVTLSGCETALGRLRKGEGMLGLQRAFLQAGAESVVVSLWSVEDSTADFMEAFYRNIRNGQSLSVALRNAKLQYQGKTLALGSGQRMSLSHPFFWAPFVLTTTSLKH